MSAVVRCPNGEIKIYTKGADTVIFERLAKNGNLFLDKTIEHLDVTIFKYIYTQKNKSLL